MTTKPDQTTRRQHLQRVGGVTLTAIGGTAFATTNSATADGESPPQGILSDGIGVEGGDMWAFIQGYMSAQTRTNTPAETLTDRIRNEFNANSDAWLDYGNWLISEFDDVEPLGTVALGVDIVQPSRMYERGDDEIVETTLEAVYDDDTDEYTSLEWRLDTDGPDYRATIQGKDAENAADDLQWYRREFFGDDRDGHELPNEKQASRLAGKYMSVFDSETQNALGLLIGEIA